VEHSLPLLLSEGPLSLSLSFSFFNGALAWGAEPAPFRATYTQHAHTLIIHSWTQSEREKEEARETAAFLNYAPVCAMMNLVGY